MLKGIPQIISPDLMKILMEMGHGDDIVISDGNFPAASCAQRLVNSHGLSVVEILDAILQFFPLDTFVQKPVFLMKVVNRENYEPQIWDEFRKLVSKHEKRDSVFEIIERFAFYEKAKKAYAIVATSDLTLYSCIILKKGIIIT